MRYVIQPQTVVPLILVLTNMPFATAKPILIPVKLPGPLVTAK